MSLRKREETQELVQKTMREDSVTSWVASGLPGAMLCRIGFLLLALACVAQPETEKSFSYVCGFLPVSPKLDGEVRGDPGWGDVPVVSGFRNLDTRQPASKDTSFRVGCDASGLYVGIVCQEPKIEDMVAEGGDGDSLWEEDSVEVFLCLDGHKELQFVVNPMGARASPVTLRSWRAETAIGDDSWSVEILLPWEILGRPAVSSETWRFNVCRNILGSGEMIHTTWAPVRFGFHEPERFGWLHFEDLPESLSSLRIQPVEQEAIQENLWVYTKHKIGVQARTPAGRQRLAFKQGPHVCPKISPCGRHILYHASEGGPMGIWRVAKDGQRTERLCDGEQATWHPEGDRIALVRQGQILERDLEGGQERTLAFIPGRSFSFPCYTSQGEILCVEEQSDSLLLFRPGGRDPEILTRGGGLAWPASSRHGAHVAFQRGAHIEILDRESGDCRRLTLAAGVQSNPVWDLEERGLVYGQADDPLSLSWSLFHIAIEGPQVPSSLEPHVMPGFDWRGTLRSPSRESALLGENLALWGLHKPLTGRVLGAHGMTEEHGERLSRESGAYPFGRPLAVETDWWVLGMGQEGLLLFSKENHMLKDLVEIRIEEGERTIQVDEMRVLSWTGDGMDLELWAGSRQAPVKVGLILDRSHPMLRFFSKQGKVSLGLDRRLSGVVLPDRLSSDLWKTSPAKGAGTEAFLPWSGLTLGLLERPGGMLILVREDPEQETDVDRKYKGMTVTLTSEPIHVGVVLDEGLWSHATPEAGDGESMLRCAWRRPFHASWRITATDGKTAWSRMWSPQLLADMEPGFLPLAETGEGCPDRAVIYAYGRTAQTPFNLRTPQDLMLDALGVADWLRFSDEVGIRGYRTGGVPFRELTTREVGWAPWEAHLEKEEFGALDLLSGLFAADTAATKGFAEDLARASVGLLEGLDERIEEYEAFYPGFLQDMQRAKVPSDVQGLARDAWTLGRQMERTDLSGTEGPLQAFLSLFGRNEGPFNTDDAVYKTDELKAFSLLCRRILAERQELLSCYRLGLTRTREALGWHILGDALFRKAGDRLRQDIQKILRDRFYLEGDWRGEEPLQTWKEGCL